MSKLFRSVLLVTIACVFTHAGLGGVDFSKQKSIQDVALMDLGVGEITENSTYDVEFETSTSEQQILQAICFDVKTIVLEAGEKQFGQSKIIPQLTGASKLPIGRGPPELV